jgi:hypothetical protein
MENNDDLAKQMLVSLVRKALFTLGSYLLARGWITPEISQSIIGDSFVWYVVGLLMVVGAVAWQWLKIRFNNLALKTAVRADPGTTVSEVKAEVAAAPTLTTSL